MQRALTNEWLDPSLIAFAEEEYAKRGRRRSNTPASLRPKQDPIHARGARQKSSTALRLSAIGLLLSSAAFSYFAWSTTLTSLPSTVIGLALESTGSSANISVAGKQRADAETADLKELIYQLRAENHALQLRLSELRERVDQTAEDFQPSTQPVQPAHSDPAVIASTELATTTGP